MEKIYIPNEEDIKRWVTEACEAAIPRIIAELSASPFQQGPEPLLTRKQLGDMLDVSMVTLHNWMKKGLPRHKQQGRVYFLRSEVINYMKAKTQRSDGSS